VRPPAWRSVAPPRASRCPPARGPRAARSPVHAVHAAGRSVHASQGYASPATRTAAPARPQQTPAGRLLLVPGSNERQISTSAPAGHAGRVLQQRPAHGPPPSTDRAACRLWYAKTEARAHHIVQDVDAQGGADEQALPLPERPVGGDQAGAEDGQERVEAEVEVLDVRALPRLRAAAPGVSAAVGAAGGLATCWRAALKASARIAAAAGPTAAARAAHTRSGSSTRCRKAHAAYAATPTRSSVLQGVTTRRHTSLLHAAGAVLDRHKAAPPARCSAPCRCSTQGEARHHNRQVLRPQPLQ